ncbi:MAG: polysaccharide export protein [Rhodospirillales bacterium]|nr:polysaccharide export protein [Rhodospirillales bacterium]
MMKVLRLLGLPALVVALVFLAVPLSAQQVDYHLGAGDRLKVTVFGHEDLSGELEVGASGTISMPLIGEIKVDGRTPRDIEGTIIDKLKPDYLKNPKIAVEVLDYRPFYIIGEVKSPGSYPYVSGMRVVNAIALAGGYTYRARENRLLITRGETGQKADADHGTVVMPGDVVEVPERFF